MRFVNTIEPEHPLRKGLYILATPIGNLGDITYRAVTILQQCDVIACEDSRVTGKLLHALKISKPLIRYDDHSTAHQRGELVALARDKAVVLVSDAGTPLISDPGYRLVQDMHKEGVFVTTIPGPCAAISAITLSGLPSDRFMFAGFLPVKDKARDEVLRELAHVQSTLIFYDTGPRLVKSLEAIARLWPNRSCAVARELTKLFEECVRGLAAECAAHYRAHPPKGEIVLVIGPPPPDIGTSLDSDSLLREALKHMKTGQAASEVAKMTGLDRKELYARALELRAESSEG